MPGFIIAIGALNGFVLGGILLVIKNGNQLATRLFGGILICLSLTMAEEFADLQGFVHELPHLSRLTDGLIFLISPMLYLYVLILTEKKRRLEWIDLLHSTPFVIFTVLLLPYYLLDGASKLVYQGGIKDTILAYSKAVPFTIYLFFTVRETLRIDRERVKKQLPINNYRNIIWFRRFLFSLMITGIVSLTYYILQDMGIVFQVDSDTASSMVLSVIFYANGFMLIKNPFILWGTEQFKISQREWKESGKDMSASKYKNSPLSIEEQRAFLDTLMKVMEEEKPYLNPELKPGDLEALTEIKSHYISQTINELLRKNFYEFVNAYRIDEVKKRVGDPAESHKTLLGIGLDSGFNSKSSFNRIFKNYTGLTPSQYKKKHVDVNQ